MAPLPNPKLTSRQALDDVLAKAAARSDLPALFMGVATATDVLYLNQAGDRVFGDASKGQVNEDTPVELYSQTKLITAIACLQLVDAGKLTLDGHELIAKHLPELVEQKVLVSYDEEPVFEDVKTPITLRMLLNHTAGTVYSFFPGRVAKWCQVNKIPGAFTGGIEALATPLGHQPDTTWMYSTGFDWAGVLVERVTGGSLGDYMKKHIFEPVGVTTMTFYPSEQLTAIKMYPVMATPEGLKVVPNGSGMGRPTDPSQVKLEVGGGGLYGSQKDYLKVLSGVLASAPNNPNKPASPLLSERGYTELFTPCLSTNPEVNAAQRAAIAGMFNMTQDPRPPFKAEDMAHSAGLGVFTSDGAHGKRAGTGFWGGAAKTTFWIDPASGVAVVFGTSLLAMGPGAGRGAYEDVQDEFEEALYASLSSE